ncbi:MAG: hypothetical protein U5J63_13775 [Fodinibius sp.]|nr:hypothetical protein [Fodinibius sp.]
MFFGVLIILMVYVPVMTFSGMEGILYRPMAITVGHSSIWLTDFGAGVCACHLGYGISEMA